MASDPRPLLGRRILITRAPEQAEELLCRLRELGAEVLLLPMVRFLAPTDTVALDRAVATLAEFEWLLFTSANAVRFFVARCRDLRQGPPGVVPRIAAIGASTSAALDAEGWGAAFIPRQSSGAALAAEIAREVAGKNVLLPRSNRADGTLPAALRASGANVTEVTAYRTAETQSLDPAIEAALLRGEVDAVTFFSPSAFDHFLRALGKETVSEISKHVAFAAVGPVTASAVRRAGHQVAVKAVEASSASLAAALGEYFSALPAKEKEGN